MSVEVGVGGGVPLGPVTTEGELYAGVLLTKPTTNAATATEPAVAPATLHPRAIRSPACFVPSA